MWVGREGNDCGGSQGTTDRADARRFAKIAKQRVVYSLREEHGVRRICIWQEGYHDWVLRPQHSIEDAVRYVLENRVRAGLVGRAVDDLHSSADLSGRDS